MSRLAVGLALVLAACASPAPSPTSSVVRMCSARDVRMTARSQGGGGGMAGGVRLEVTSPTACALPGQLRIDLVDGQGQAMTVDEVAAALCDVAQPAACVAAARVDLGPGEAASARFVWQNWCGPLPNGFVGLAVELAVEPRDLSAPIVDTGGAPSTVTPRCDVPTEPSTLAVGPVEKR